jgi:hypothetical protein
MKQSARARVWLVSALCAGFVLVATVDAAPAGDKVENLAKALLGDPSVKVRTQAALLLGKLGDAAGAESLAKALSDENKTVRGAAAQSLGKVGGDKAVAALKQLLARESDTFVREQADKALSVLLARPRTTQDTKERKLYLKFGPFTGGSKAADPTLLALLRVTLRQSMDKLPHVVVAEGADEKNLGGKNSSPAFLVDGNVLKLEDRDAGRALETSCEVKAMIARWPSRSIILWTTAGAAVQGGKRERDRGNARRDCIEASANQLSDSLVDYFKSQGG